MSIYRLFAAVAFILMALEMLGMTFPRQKVVVAICLIVAGVALIIGM
jgi:hypothetical protein